MLTRDKMKSKLETLKADLRSTENFIKTCKQAEENSIIEFQEKLNANANAKEFAAREISKLNLEIIEINKATEVENKNKNFTQEMIKILNVELRNAKDADQRIKTLLEYKQKNEKHAQFNKSSIDAVNDFYKKARNSIIKNDLAELYKLIESEIKDQHSYLNLISNIINRYTKKINEISQKILTLSVKQDPDEMIKRHFENMNAIREKIDYNVARKKELENEINDLNRLTFEPADSHNEQSLSSSSSIDDASEVSQPTPLLTYPIKLVNAWVDSLLDTTVNYAKEVAAECPSYFPEYSQSYWSDTNSHTLFKSSIMLNATSNSSAIAYTPTQPMIQ